MMGGVATSITSCEMRRNRPPTAASATACETCSSSPLTAASVRNCVTCASLVDTSGFLAVQLEPELRRGQLLDRPRLARRGVRDERRRVVSDHVAEGMTIARFLAPAARCQQTQRRPATVHPAAPHHGLYRVDARVRRYLWVLELVEVAVAIRVAGDVGVIVRRGLIDHLVFRARLG